jgi:outer membrane lipoprotein-sorting protein
MRTNVTIALLAALTLAGPLGASEKEAKEILERAIKAHGGSSALARAARCKRTDTGTVVIQGRQVPFVSQVAFDVPQRLRWAMEVDKNIKTVMVLDGDKAYQNDGGVTRTLEAPSLKEVREEAYIHWIITLAPLTKSEFTLSALEKTKVGKDAVVGIKVSRKGYPDVSLYFLEKGGLLVKAEWRGQLARLEVDKERLYSAHKAFDGVKVHTKETALFNGKKFNEFTISNVSFPEKLDDKTFAKP